MTDLTPDLYGVPPGGRWLAVGEHRDHLACYGTHGAWWTDRRGWEDVTYLRSGSARTVGARSRHLRLVTRTRQAAPATLTVVFDWLADRWPDGPPHRGVHLHAGHLDNSTNYAASIRMDGRLTVVQQYAGTYTRLAPYVPFPLRHGIRYVAQLTWTRDHDVHPKLRPATLTVWQPERTEGAGRSEHTAKVEQHVRFPPLPVGQVGVRVDGQDVRLVAMHITEQETP